MDLLTCRPSPAPGELLGPAPEASIAARSSSASTSPWSESRYGLDPQLLPSAVQVMKEDEMQWEGNVFVSESPSSVPPLSTTRCVLEDGGNATARFVRCTSYNFPVEAESAQKSRLPLAAVVCPLALLEEGEALPVRAAGDCVRGCGHCGAFMSPALTWQDCGQRFHCPFCQQLNEVPWQSYQPTAQGRRVDWDRRPELRLGSYEILEEKKGNAAALLIAIDVSVSAVRAGQLSAICRHLSAHLQALPVPDGTVALMTYDSRIHLWDLSPALSRPHVMVMAEREELELPVVDGLLVPLRDCAHTIQRVLQEIGRFGLENESDSEPISLDVPVSAGLKILQAAGSFGKLLIFHSSAVHQGTDLEHSSFFTPCKVKSIFQAPESSSSLAEKCVKQGCSVQMFLFSSQEMGGAWPGHIPFLTGGGLYCYPCLEAQAEQQRFQADLTRSVSTQTAFRAQLRVFVSAEMRLSASYGTFLFDSGCVAMAALDWRTTLAFEFSHVRALDEARGVALQFVLSYVSWCGESRTRVHTLTLPATRQLLDSFRSSQAETLLTFYCKKLYSAALERPVGTLREELQTDVTEALACFRKLSSSASPAQLLLPRFLKALPVYVNSLRKSEVLLPGLRSSVHQRLQLRSRLVCMDTPSTVTHFYPRVLPVGVGPPEPLSAGLRRCSASALDPGGLYLICGPLALLLWVGSRVPPDVLLELFSCRSFSGLRCGQVTLPALETSLSVRTRALLRSLQAAAPVTLQAELMREGEGAESLQRLLVEDKSPNGGASYADFLYHLHRGVLRLVA